MIFTPTFVQWLVKVGAVSGLISISGSAGFFTYRYINDKSFRDRGKASEETIKEDWKKQTSIINKAIDKVRSERVSTGSLSS